MSEIHPAAAAVPPMQDDQFSALVESVRELGLLVPIELLDDQVIDGRHRLRACEQLGIEPVYVDADLAGLTPEEYVYALNYARRHLTPSQLACKAVEEELPKFEAEAKERQGKRNDLAEHGGTISTKSENDSKARDKAAAVVGVNPRYVSDAKRVKEKDPALFERVKAGEVTLPQAKREISPPPPRSYPISDKLFQLFRDIAVAMEEVNQFYGGWESVFKHEDFERSKVLIVKQLVAAFALSTRKAKGEIDAING
ncbi:MAG: ParB N-terminal domain-containing protein [Planctomycetales bacterium]|nr:ParB N-terminal domain-containing protein [Planctomycetales bacterium]